MDQKFQRDDRVLIELDGSWHSADYLRFLPAVGHVVQLETGAVITVSDARIRRTDLE
jgi:hypothetical protein